MSNVYEQEAKRRGKSNNLRPLRSLLPFLGSYRRQIAYALVSLLVASGANTLAAKSVSLTLLFVMMAASAAW